MGSFARAAPDQQVIEEWVRLAKRAIRLEAYFKSLEYSYDFEGSRSLHTLTKRYAWPEHQSPVENSRDSHFQTWMTIPTIPDIEL